MATRFPQPQPINDPDVVLLATISATLMPDYVNTTEDPWSASPFSWIKTRPSRQMGAIGEQLVAGRCAAKGLDVTRTGDVEADRVINGKRVEINSRHCGLMATMCFSKSEISDMTTPCF